MHLYPSPSSHFAAGFSSMIDEQHTSLAFAKSHWPSCGLSSIAKLSISKSLSLAWPDAKIASSLHLSIGAHVKPRLAYSLQAFGDSGRMDSSLQQINSSSEIISYEILL